MQARNKKTSLRLSQKALKPKIQHYLRLQKRDKNLINKFRHGYCHGFTTTVLYAMYLTSISHNNKTTQPTDDWDWLNNTLQCLGAWDKKLESLSQKNKVDIDRFIALIEFFQNVYRYLKIGQGCLDKFLEDTYGRQIKFEFALAGLFIREDCKKKLSLTINGKNLQTTLIRLLLRHNKRLIYLGSGKHSIGLFRNKNQVMLYDSQYRYGPKFFTMKQKSYLLSKIRLFKTYPTPIGIRIFTFGSIAAYPTPDSLLKQLRPRSLYQNPLDGKYFSALYISVFIRSEACVAFYLNENASTMLPLSTSFTPFYLAVKRGFLNIVKLFLAKGADINEIHKTKTPLIVAAKHSHLPILLTMFDYKNNRTLKNLVTALLYLKKSLREDFLNLLDEGKLHNMLKNLELEVPNKKNRKVYELLQTKNHPLGLFAKTRSFYDKKALFTSEYEQRRISL